VNHTSQLSRIAQSPPATDLSGGKASEDFSTVRSNNLAVEAAVDFQFDLPLDVVASTRADWSDRSSSESIPLFSGPSLFFDSPCLIFFRNRENGARKLILLQDWQCGQMRMVVEAINLTRGHHAVQTDPTSAASALEARSDRRVAIPCLPVSPPVPTCSPRPPWLSRCPPFCPSDLPYRPFLQFSAGCVQRHRSPLIPPTAI